MRVNKAINKLKEQIELAFPSSCKLTHEDGVELRSKLVSLYDEDVLILLGWVLIDILDTYNNLKPELEGMVVQFLGSANPCPLPEIRGLAGCKRNLDAFAAQQQKESSKLFNRFTRAQINVVCEWLKVVKSWEESIINEDELDAALKYWNDKRVKQSE